MSDPPAERVRRFEVDDDHHGDRLDVALADWLGESRNQAAGRLARGEVRVGGTVAGKSHRCQAGELVVVAPPPTPETGAAGVAPPPVRYEDDDLLVVAKPAGMVVHPGVGNPAGTLVQTLVAAGVALAPAGGDERPGVVHRLDRDTSGLLVVAKTDEAYRGLVAQLRSRVVERRYLALVEGTMPAGTGRVDAPVGRDPRDRKRFAAVSDGKPALTHWEVRATGTVPDTAGATASLLVCRLETGRTHQIRVHLTFAGHPVVGDVTYGARPDVAVALGLERFFLHAFSLRFAHPVRGHEIAVVEPLPDDLSDALAAAGIEPPADTVG